jgi:hypothetical protein
MRKRKEEQGKGSEVRNEGKIKQQEGRKKEERREQTASKNITNNI